MSGSNCALHSLQCEDREREVTFSGVLIFGCDALSNVILIAFATAIINTSFSGCLQRQKPLVRTYSHSMEQFFYDSSWTVYAIPTLTPSLARLLLPTTEASVKLQLAALSQLFWAYLTRERPRYEQEEEKEQVGELKQSTWAKFSSLSHAGSGVRAGTKRKRDDSRHRLRTTHGMWISIGFEKRHYRFVLYTQVADEEPGRKRRLTVEPNSLESISLRAGKSYAKASNVNDTASAILLACAPPAVLKQLLGFCQEQFHTLPDEMHLLKFPSTLLRSSLEQYIAKLYSSFAGNDHHSDAEGEHDKPPDLKLLRSIVGTVKIGILFGPPVAPHLNNIEMAIPPQSVLSVCEGMASTDHEPEERVASNPWLRRLYNSLESSLGLRIPLASDETNTATLPNSPLSEQRSKSPAPGKPEQDPPLRIGRITTNTFAMLTDSRLKFVSKPLSMAAIRNEDGEEENILKLANQDILDAVFDEARRQRREGTIETGPNGFKPSGVPFI